MTRTADGDDPFVVALERAMSEANDARAALGVVVEMLGSIREQHVVGAKKSEVLTHLLGLDAPDARRRSATAFHAYEQALSVYRAEMFRALVEEGMNFSEIGELAGVSRQVVARLYRSVVDLR